MGLVAGHRLWIAMAALRTRRPQNAQLCGCPTAPIVSALSSFPHACPYTRHRASSSGSCLTSSPPPSLPTTSASAWSHGQRSPSSTTSARGSSGGRRPLPRESSEKMRRHSPYSARGGSAASTAREAALHSLRRGRRLTEGRQTPTPTSQLLGTPRVRGMSCRVEIDVDVLMRTVNFTCTCACTT